MNYIDVVTNLIRSDGVIIPKDPNNSDYRAALVSGNITVKPANTKLEAKAAALTSATALGFSLDQLRVIRAIVLLATGTPAQKLKATALLQPLVQLAGDALAIAAQIDAGQIPAALNPPIIPTDDP